MGAGIPTCIQLAPWRATCSGSFGSPPTQTMSYSPKTLAAFSEALLTLYATSSEQACGETMRFDPGHSDDEAYLAALWQSHVVANAERVAKLKNDGGGREPPGTAEFLPLRTLGLTLRECEVVFWIAQGKRDSEIATILNIAPKTVSKHVEHILAKLGAETRLGAVSTAIDWLRQHA
jgi:DNA-binding CsgD family transcriptional regulator